jgi:hypothetical protein
MGGYNSGRHGGRPAVEDGLTLNLNTLIREGLFCPNQDRRGSIVWTNTTTGERVGWIGYHAEPSSSSGV